MYYRRANISGATYFLTVVLQDRKSTLLTEYIHTLRASFNYVKSRHPFKLDALVVLPDHFHVLMTLPEGDSNFSKRISLIKSSFTRKVPKMESLSSSRIRNRERGIWQRRFWEHVIQSSEDYEAHYHYILFNPVKHGHVDNASDWPYSTIHRDIERGLIPKNWGMTNEIEGCSGE
jgi:putative transposase